LGGALFILPIPAFSIVSPVRGRCRVLQLLKLANAMSGDSADHQMHSYTAFPNLCVAVTSTPYPELPTHDLVELRIPSDVSKKSILVSWSQILRGYVPGDNVVFRVGNEVVHVDFLTGSVECIPEKNIRVGEEESSLQRCTGIYFQTVCLPASSTLSG